MDTMPMAIPQHGVQLPVMATLFNAWRLVVAHWRVLLKYAIPMIIGYTCLFFYRETVKLQWGAFDHKTLLMVELSLFLIFSFGTIMSIVAFYQIFLLNTEEKLPVFRWSMVETRYLLWTLVLLFVYVVILYLMARPLSYIYSYHFFFIETVNWFQESLHFEPMKIAIIVLLMTLIALYLIAKWSLVFPAVAIGYREMSLSKASKLGTGNRLRLVVIVFLIPALLTTAFDLILYALGYNISINLWGIDFSIFNPISILMHVVLLSASYDFLAKQVFVKNM